MALRIPSPKALTKPEAYLAYKAGIMSRDELKQSVYNPLNNYEGWLAKWCGLLETYPTNEDGTPQCLTDEEGLLAYLCGVTNRYPATNSRPDDARISAYIRYLVSARYVRPDHPLNREEFYLSLIKTQVVPSGDPSSDIVIDGTAKAPFVDVRVYGDTYQQTYTGKNLLNIPDISNTSSGVGVTVNKGVISCAGTVTASWGFNIAGANSAVFSTALPAGDYAVSINKALDIPIKVVFADSESQTIGTATITAGNTSVAYTIPREAVKATVWSNAAQNTQVNISGLQVMVESGSTATSFEPFVGGQPSPSPDYPQTIQTVTGEQTVTVTGKNLFNNEAIPYEARRAYSADGSVQSWSGYVGTVEYQPVEPNTQYTIWNNKISNTTYLCEYDENKNFIQRTIEATTFTTTATTRYLRWSLSVGSGEIPPTQTQLEKGSTATDYEPYSSNDYEINLGKNLWSATTLVNGYYKFADGGLATGNTNYVTSTEKIDVTAGESYHISADKGVGVAGSGCVFFNNDTFVSSSINPSGSNFTVPEGANKMAFNFFNSAGLSPSEVTHIQLELGSTASSYAPYFEPIELCKIGTYQDYIWEDGDEWKLHKATKTKVYDGTNQGFNYRANTGVSGKHRFQLDGSAEERSIPRSSSGSYFDGLCNEARAGSRDMTFNSQYLGGNVIAPATESAYGYIGVVYVAAISEMTLDEANAWLATHNIVVTYALATPTDTVITNQNLIDQLNALKQGGAEEGTTYIKVSATDPNLPAKLYVEAPKYD